MVTTTVTDNGGGQGTSSFVVDVVPNQAPPLPGLSLLEDINNLQTAASNPADLVAYNGSVYFAADDGIHGKQLWKSDGTAAGTVMVTDINPGPAGSIPFHPDLAVFQGALYFAAADGTSSGALWKTDGTAAGTVLVAGAAMGIDDVDGMAGRGKHDVLHQ